MLKFSSKNIKIIPLIYIAFVLCTTGLPLYLGGYYFMKKIKLTQGKYALVDDEDYGYLNQFKWWAAKSRKVYYAMCNIDGTQYRMHRLIMKATPNQIIDHRDFDGLNNQKYNLRFCTYAQNAWNRKGRGVSKYLGVSLELRPSGLKYWVASIKIDGTRTKRIGRFKTEKEAAIARDEMSHKLHGEFAYLNFPDELNKKKNG